MAVYFKFKSAKDYDSIPIDGHFISVSTLKEKIFESKHLGRGTDFDLLVTNAHTNEEYLDEDMLIPKNTSVLIRRVPGRPRMPIVTEPVNEQYEPKIQNNQSGDIQTTKSSFLAVDSSTAGYPEDVEWDEFGTDLYAIPEAQASQLSNPVHENTIAHSKEDEDSKIKALIDTQVLDWQRQASDGFGAGRGFGRGGGRMMGGRGFGRGGGVLERKTPPPGYICHRCKVSGHFIQHCPTNGDPNFDIKRVKPPTGIPKSMLMATPDGSYSLPSGVAAVLKPNEDAFAREMLGLPSTHLVSDLPPELRCPLCTEVMKDAVLTSKCCFRSFCDKCIRNYFMSKQMCVCGAKNILADDLLPNKTVRDTISRLMESTNSSQENVGSTFQVQDMESKFPEPNLKDKAPSSPTVSATSKGKEVVLPPHDDGVLKATESSAQVNAVVDSSDKMLEKSGTGKVPDVSEATHDSISVKEPASQISGAPLVDEEVQQKQIISDAGKKKKKKKTRPPMNEMQWKMTQDLAAENYMMPMGGPAAYNPYWNGMQPGMEAYGAPHYPGSLPYMGYGFGGPLDVPFGMMPQDPFGGVQQGFMMPPIHPQQRDLSEMGMGFNMGHHPHHPHQPAPIMSREEFEARKADLRMKREFERRGAVGGERRDTLLPKEQPQPQPQPQPRGGGGGGPRQISSSSRDGPPQQQQQLKPKPKIAPSSTLPPPSSDYRHRPERSSPERSARGPDAPRPSSKRKSSEYDQEYDRRDDQHHRDSRDRDRDRDREHHSRHGSKHHRAESSVAKSSSPTPPLPSQQQQQMSSKLKPSVFSRISFPEGGEKEAAAAAVEGGGSKKRKISSSGSEAPTQHHHHSKASENGNRHEDYKISSSSKTVITSGSVIRKNAASAAVVADYESSDDDRHFKRRPSRYESSPPITAIASQQHEDSRHSRGTRDRERERERDRERDRGDRKHR